MSEQQLARVRAICSTFPETEEKLSHGEPTFFVRKKVFAMFANNHHNDRRIAVWLPAAQGVQATLIEAEPDIYFKPPYVGVRGWIGVNLAVISDDDLTMHITDGWYLIAPKKLHGVIERE